MSLVKNLNGFYQRLSLLWPNQCQRCHVIHIEATFFLLIVGKRRYILEPIHAYFVLHTTHNNMHTKCIDNIPVKNNVTKVKQGPLPGSLYAGNNVNILCQLLSYWRNEDFFCFIAQMRYFQWKMGVWGLTYIFHREGRGKIAFAIKKNEIMP